MSAPDRFSSTAPGAVLVALSLFAVSPAAPQTPTFSSRVEAVRVDVLVTENGRPVRGLTRDDFEIRDNGVPQDVTLISSEELPLNIVLVLDASNSVRGERLDHLQAAARALVAALARKDRAALVTFSHTVRLGSPLTGDASQLRQAIAGIAPGGNTALFDASYVAMALAESDVGRDLLVVFTDGADTASYLRRETVVDAARATEVVAYGAVVVGRDRPKFLDDFAKQTGGSVLEIRSSSDLSSAFLRILEEFRQRYLLSYSPRGVARSGWHRIEVRVKNGHALVKARAGYVAGQ